MDSSNPKHLLTEWSLTTFHVCLFFASVVFLLYLNGSLRNLLASLNTLLGSALFVAFWITTWFCTSRALRGIPWSAIENPPRQPNRVIGLLAFGGMWGGIDGLLFLLALSVTALLVSIFALFQPGQPSALPLSPILLIFVVAIGSIVAFAVGAIFGVLFGIVDGLLLYLTRYLFEFCIMPGSHGQRQPDRMAELGESTGLPRSEQYALKLRKMDED